MTDADVIPREQALASARRALDRARAERDHARAAGRLPAELELACRRLERQRPRPAAHRAAA
ncbi:hypothetical protein ACFCXS_15450 [Streptomyces sp. NPDC056373]|uniref:hypothetical protein n=1 Tax=Streptomyces sp. NPDC056373 TaxID=3345798 RepID=UPI0035DC8AFF